MIKHETDENVKQNQSLDAKEGLVKDQGVEGLDKQGGLKKKPAKGAAPVGRKIASTKVMSPAMAGVQSAQTKAMSPTAAGAQLGEQAVDKSRPGMGLNVPEVAGPKDAQKKGDKKAQAKGAGAEKADDKKGTAKKGELAEAEKVSKKEDKKAANKEKAKGKAAGADKKAGAPAGAEGEVEKKKEAEAPKKKEPEKGRAKRVGKGATKSKPKAASKKGGALGGGGGGRGRKKGGGGGGGGGGGSIAVPSIGGGGPTLSPKPEGAGNNAVERFANSGLSYQVKSLGGLGAKTDVDYQKNKSEVDGKIPDEGGSPGGHEAGSAKATAAGDQTKQGNVAIKTNNFDTSANIDQGKQESINQGLKGGLGGGGEEIPPAPQVQVDKTAIESGRSEESTKYAAAQSDGSNKVSSLKKDLPVRGFDDVKAQKPEVNVEGNVAEAGDVAALADVQELSSEGQGILDVSELATSATASMQGAVSQVAEAESKTKADADAEIAKHEEAVEQERQKADAEEKAAIEAKKGELEAQVASESAQYNAEISSYDAENQSLINSANSELDSEKGKAQGDIDREHAKGVRDKQAKEQEAEGKKNDKSWLDKAADWVKSKIEEVANWLKNAIRTIIETVKKAIFAAIDTFVAVVSKINKGLGDKLKKAFDKFKKILDKLAKALIDFVDKAIDYIAQKAKELVDKVVTAIQALVDALKEFINALLTALKAAYDAAVNAIKGILSGLAEIFKKIFMKACEFAGVDPGIFASAMGSVREIIKNPGQFFGALARGFVQGFRNFGANIGENVKAVFTNLWNLWLGSAGVSMPGSFSVQSLIKLGLEIIGVDVNSILKQMGIKNIDDLNDLDDSAPGAKFVRELQSGGIGALVKYVQAHVGDIAKEIMNAAIQSIVQAAATQAIAKLAMLATPVSGIIAALKAVWDLVQFVRSNLSAIAGLATSVIGLMGSAANGDSSGVAAAVEASLCQVIPLAIDLCLRLAGINVGGKIQALLGRVRTKIKGAVDKVIGKFKGGIGKKKNGRKKPAQKTAKQKRHEAEDQERAAKKKEEKRKQKQGRAGAFADRVNSGLDARKEKSKGKAIDVTALAGALNGEKKGNLGVNLDNVGGLKGRENARNKKVKEKKLQNLAKKEKETGKILADKQKEYKAKYGKGKSKSKTKEQLKLEKEIAKLRTENNKQKKETARFRKENQGLQGSPAGRDTNQKDKTSTKPRDLAEIKKAEKEKAKSDRASVQANVDFSKELFSNSKDLEELRQRYPELASQNVMDQQIAVGTEIRRLKDLQKQAAKDPAAKAAFDESPEGKKLKELENKAVVLKAMLRPNKKSLGAAKALEKNG